MVRRVIVVAPTRIDLAGGPSDVSPFSTQEWGAVVNAAINRYARVEIQTTSAKQINVISKDLKIKQTFSDYSSLLTDVSPLQLITKAIGEFEFEHGMDVMVETQVPPGSGLGGSAAISTALLYGLSLLSNSKSSLNKDTLVQEAIQLETEKLGNIVGGQDQYASAFGGVSLFTFNKIGISRKKLSIESAVLDQLNSSLLLCYSGVSHLSGEVLSKVMRNFIGNNRDTTHNLRRLREIALEVELCLMTGNIEDIGSLLNSAWYAQKSLHSAISSPEIEAILSIAMANGATGGKVTGAGGGGCVLIACAGDIRGTIMSKLKENNFEVIPFQIEERGVDVIYDETTS